MALVFSYGYCCGIFLYNCGGLFTLNVATFANAMGVVFFLSMWSSFSDLMVVVFCIVTFLHRNYVGLFLFSCGGLSHSQCRVLCKCNGSGLFQL